MAIKETADKVQLVKEEVDKKHFMQKLDETLELKLCDFNLVLNKKKQDFLRALRLDEKDCDLSAPGVLDNVKQTFNITPDDANRKIILESKIEAGNEDAAEYFGYFEKDLEANLQSFIRSFTKLGYTLKKKISPDGWIAHPNIQIGLSSDSDGIVISRTQEDNTLDYFCALYTVPLDNRLKIKMTVNSIWEPDRFLDFGVVSQSKFEQIKNDSYINVFGSGAISYCGYSYTVGISGKKLSSNSSSDEGFKPGTVCILDYNPKEAIRFYNEDLTLDLKMNLEGNVDTHYLFVTLYHFQTSCTLELLDDN